MNTHTANKGRKPSIHIVLEQRSLTCTITSEISSFLSSGPGVSLIVLAVFACSCMKDVGNVKTEVLGGTEPTIISMKGSDGNDAGQIEKACIFSFSADSLGRLESYQRLGRVDNEDIFVYSTSGRKRIVVCCNLEMDEDQIMKISTMEDLERFACMLEDVRRAAPIMIGSIETDAGKGERLTMTLKPMTSTIILRSICSSFKGTSYEGESITDAKVYLTNVNAQCNISQSPQTAKRFINMGMLNMDDVSGFLEPDIIVQDMKCDICEVKMECGISLICFHNHCKDESPGSPFTRLVVEGRIQGKTYYWPLTVNRTEGGRGIGNNTRHVFDLTIRRKGCDDPDSELLIEDSETIMEVLEWEEKDAYSVVF